MTRRSVIRRATADADVQEAVDYYLREAGQQVTLRFVDALEKAFLHIGDHPGSGSARYANELGLPGLRCWPIKPYPYLVFYVDRDTHIDVWRVLHEQRDIPAWLLDD